MTSRIPPSTSASLCATAPETKVFEAVRKILTELSASAWKTGVVIDQEAQMIDRYRIGRGTFREAVRLLEADGLVRMKTGRQGGLILEATPVQAAQGLIETAIRFNDVPLLDVWDAGSILLAEAAELAADHIETRDIAALRRHVHGQSSYYRNPAKANESRLLLRTMIARISGNSLLQVLLPTITRIGLEHVPQGMIVLESNAKKIAMSLAHEQALVEAIISGDVSLARQYVKDLIAFDRKNIAANIAKGDVAATILPVRSDGQPRGQVYMVAGNVKEKIALCPFATRVGTEEDLAEHFGVGRLTIRQALRLLEHRGVIEVRRGKGGGLFKAIPSFDRPVEMVQLYLRFSEICPDDAILVARAFDLTAAPAAARGKAADGRANDLLKDGLTYANLSNWLAEQRGSAVGSFVSRILSGLRPDGDRTIQPAIAIPLMQAIVKQDAGVTRRIVRGLHRLPYEP